MKLLVTGGCGFLGSNIAAWFLEQGERVTIADAQFRQGGAANLQWLQKRAAEGQLQFHKGDLAEPDFVQEVFARSGPFDYIAHLGGQVAMTTSLADPRRDLMTNVVGTFNVLEAARAQQQVPFFAYSSTNKVYGDLKDLRYAETKTRYVLPDFPLGLDESLPLDFASPYGCSKGAADQYVRDWFRNFGLPTVVFRHSSIYGGRQFSTYDQGWIGWFCQKMLEQRGAQVAGETPAPFTISGTGKQVRDVLHAEDLVALYASAYQRRDAVAGEIFNIGGGMENSLSLLELLRLLGDMLKLEDEPAVAKQPRRQSDQDFFVADIRKAAELLAWRPKVGLENGIGKMLEWVQRAASQR
jgi:CDP-paratose 2-epimerase